ncbi:unnamed protein product [Ceratitis capitata]|uniref:(Mediterranean fruit fly) hypothetical protein n=1 Tax=Ceratitis capitata TaxID=7213 RepID=A0A811V994_CERCA|nr:unnamed protein product [Ceratitis capitata]
MPLLMQRRLEVGKGEWSNDINVLQLITLATLNVRSAAVMLQQNIKTQCRWHKMQLYRYTIYYTYFYKNILNPATLHLCIFATT